MRLVYVPIVMALELMLIALPTSDAKASELDALIERSLVPLALENGVLEGPGADWLEDRTRDVRYVLVGEAHGNAGIAHFSGALAHLLGAQGPYFTAIETDPVIAADLERLLRDPDPGALAAYLQIEGHAFAVPFYNWLEEADFLRIALRYGPAGGSVLWGLDQAFMGAVHPWAKRIEESARTPAARAEAARIAALAKDDVMSLLAKAPPEEFEALRDALNGPGDEHARELAEQLALSMRIYSPFVLGKGSVYAANYERESLMKHHLLGHLRAAQARNEVDPRVLFKFGANHLTRGLSPTNVPSLANFVFELAIVEGTQAFSMLVLCGPGSFQADFMGNATPADAWFAERFDFLAPHLTRPGLTLFDLRPWKDEAQTWRSIHAEAARSLWAFDALVIVSDAAAASLVVPR